MIHKVKVGIIGCGAISQAYFNGCKLFRNLELVACADINPAAAKTKAAENGLIALSVEELLAEPDIQIVINLTIPQAHVPVSLQILDAGKHVHLEKPLAMNTADAMKVVQTAAVKGLRVGCAPDTFLGAGIQTSRKLLDAGLIGRPVAGTAVMMGRGVETWHPNPAFYYQKGGGPMFDMGPYYLHALVNLLGPVASVSGVVARSFERRIVTTDKDYGKVLEVEVPTHYSGTLSFREGAVVTMIMSFDVMRHGHSPIEIYGSEGSLQVPDPNTFGGPVRLHRPGNEQWQECNLTHGYKENSRGIGVADMAAAILENRPHRCDGRLALHAVEVMQAFETSSREGRAVAIENQCDRPEPLPARSLPGLLQANPY